MLETVPLKNLINMIFKFSHRVHSCSYAAEYESDEKRKKNYHETLIPTDRLFYLSENYILSNFTGLTSRTVY